jgi:methionyl-tRNA formyltransferase
MAALRMIFFGTAEIACPTLDALARAPGCELVAVVTQPDRPKGRDLKLQPSAVKTEAVRLGLPVWQPERARDPRFIEQVRAAAPDLLVVMAYGQILPQSLLDVPRFGALNVHTSLLPKYRGAAPIPWAILNGDAETGVTIMKMDAGLDTGPILTQATTPIATTDNAETLHHRLAVLGAALLVSTIPEYVAGRITPRPQPTEGVSHTRKIEKEDGRLDWSQPARTLWNRIRAFTPWPGAFTFLPGIPKPTLLKIWEAEPLDQGTGQPGEVISADKDGVVIACGAGALRLTSLQREGARRLPAREFLAGCPLAKGTRLE